MLVGSYVTTLVCKNASARGFLIQSVKGGILPPLPPPISHTLSPYSLTHIIEVQKAVKDIKEAAKAAAKTQKSLESKLKKGLLCQTDSVHCMIT